MFFSIIIPSIFFRAIYIYTKLRTDINFINKFFPSIRSAIPRIDRIFEIKKYRVLPIQFSEFVINRYSIDRSLEHIFSNDCSIILLRPQFHRDEIF